MIETSFLNCQFSAKKSLFFIIKICFEKVIIGHFEKIKTVCKLSIKKIAFGEALFLQYWPQILNVCYQIIWIVSIGLNDVKCQLYNILIGIDNI